jgi:hypothetical protein
VSENRSLPLRSCEGLRRSLSKPYALLRNILRVRRSLPRSWCAPAVQYSIFVECYHHSFYSSFQMRAPIRITDFSPCSNEAAKERRTYREQSSTSWTNKKAATIDHWSRWNLEHCSGHMHPPHRELLGLPLVFDKRWIHVTNKCQRLSSCFRALARA